MRIVFWQIEAPPPEKKNPKQYTEISLYKNQTVSHGWKQGVIISPILGCTKNMWIYFLFFYSCLANLCLADLMSLLAWVPSRSSLMQISISFLFFFFLEKERIHLKKNKAVACFCKSMLQRNDSAKKVLLEKQQLPHTSPRQWICA